MIETHKMESAHTLTQEMQNIDTEAERTRAENVHRTSGAVCLGFNMLRSQQVDALQFFRDNGPGDPAYDNEEFYAWFYSAKPEAICGPSMEIRR